MARNERDRPIQQRVKNHHGVRIKALTPWWRSSFSRSLHLPGALAGCFLSLCWPHGVHPHNSLLTGDHFLFATALSAWSASSLISRWRTRTSTLPRRWPHGVHPQKQTNYVCIMRRELVDSFSGTAKSSCADYFPILFCCQSDLYHHDRQPRMGNRPVLLCEQHSHFLCIRSSH